MRSDRKSATQHVWRLGMVIFLVLVVLYFLLPLSPQDLSEAPLAVITYIISVAGFIFLRNMEWKAYRIKVEGLKSAESLYLRLKHAQELLSKARTTNQNLERLLKRNTSTEPIPASETAARASISSAPTRISMATPIELAQLSAALSDNQSLKSELAAAQEEIARLEQSRHDRDKAADDRRQQLAELREEKSKLERNLGEAQVTIAACNLKLKTHEAKLQKSLAEFFASLAQANVLGATVDEANLTGLSFLNAKLAAAISSELAKRQFGEAALRKSLSEAQDAFSQLRVMRERESRQHLQTVLENKRKYEAVLCNISEPALLAGKVLECLESGNSKAILANFSASSNSVGALAIADVATSNLVEFATLLNGLPADQFALIEPTLIQAILSHGGMSVFVRLNPELKQRLLHKLDAKSWPVFVAELAKEKDPLKLGDAVLGLCVDNSDHPAYNLAPNVLRNLAQRAEMPTIYALHYAEPENCKAAGVTIFEGHRRADAMLALVARSIALTNDVEFLLALNAYERDIVLGHLPIKNLLCFAGIWLTNPNAWPKLDNPVLQNLVIEQLPQPLAALLVLLSEKFIDESWEVLDDAALQEQLDALPDALVESMFALGLASPELFQKLKRGRSMRMCLGRVSTHTRFALCLRETEPLEQAELIFGSASLQKAAKLLHGIVKSLGWSPCEPRYFQEDRDRIVYDGSTALTIEQREAFTKARKELSPLIGRLPPLMLHEIFNRAAKSGKDSIRAELARRKVDLLASLTFWDVTPKGFEAAGFEGHDWYALSALLGVKDEFFAFRQTPGKKDGIKKSHSDDPFQGVFARFTRERSPSALKTLRSETIPGRASALAAALGR